MAIYCINLQYMAHSSKLQQHTLNKILLRPDVWRGESRRFTQKQSLDTGYEQLNSALVHAGWPCKALIEILQARLGQGEWQLLYKSLVLLDERPGYIALINPPAWLYLPGLQQFNLNYQRFLIIKPKSYADFMYSAKTAAVSRACVAILCWEPGSLAYKDLRKLQLSAAQGMALFVLFRHIKKLASHSPASLRLNIQVTRNAFDVCIQKQRGAFNQQIIRIAQPLSWRNLPALSSQRWLEEQGNDSAIVFPESSR